MRTGNGAHMKMLREGDINVDVITKNGDVTSGTLRVKVIPGMKQKLFSFTQPMLGGWYMQGGQTKQEELSISLTHEDHKPIIFDRVLKAGNSVLLAAKMVIRNPDKVNAAIVNGKQSKEYFHRVTGHAGHHLMDATAKYYKVNLTGKVNNCLSCSLEKIRQKNIPKKNEDKSKKLHQEHQEHQGLLVERWMMFQRWMRKHNPCTGEEWEHCCISPSTADLISQIL